ncbi:bifunctional (p)ppGpp synthetase/guanosine-3',5'-bis(diphosphate) 3'-pyrophosphohydrolase [Aureibaculum sp. A20]|uniref:Bifunctional (P)ppGpp synthetase/guanosine-3',5'-bis(Diphosphate) 3'-pyrophosphohydrolase n=1 Tax=Aureibaculum flavum TaxID=2795986 RepID=A0ABS0WRK2_9FLAO|nr:RelA/SpoT family protein [Aureibaculum flavum]MBJ2174617.1 bifunctional (p)ppGpp synthetase/guanosine-3',5'-bis(diphosphate) 3'-pyrophosphohydrolase [Aureibaculum flavum]
MAYTATLEEENKEIARRYKKMLSATYQHLSKTDKEMIRKAFDVAVDAHKDQRRKTGEPYIYHPIAVASIVANEIGLGATSIMCALMHDVVEDSEDYTFEDIEGLFGETVAKIVNGLTKISRLNKEQEVSIQAENFRKMLLTLNDDVRVILIKIADRLHNMQTMDAMPHHKQIKISSETLYIYAPLAHRLGLYNIKTELEDLGLKYTEPEVFNDILTKIKESKEQQEEYIKAFTESVEKTLDKENFDYVIKGRTKSIYSIRKKMLNQGVSFDEIYDKFAIRIIYSSELPDEKFNAWKIYSIITDSFNPNPNRLRDWISQPKSTGYESLHITVMGPKGRWVEVQIRSRRMDEIAEKGYAAHFKYKHGNEKESGLENWLNKLKETLENPDINAVDFVEQFKLNLYAKEIYVFTPQGDIKSLPKGSTPLDFAFAIHTDVGMMCRGAKVNGKLVPLSHTLNSGDQVQIITSISQKPKLSWLDFAQTARAKSKIKAALKEDQKLVANDGKEVLERKLRHLKVPFNEKTINELVSYFKLKTSHDLFYRLGNGGIDNQQLKNFVSQRSNAIYNFFKNTIRRGEKKPSENKNDELTDKFDLLVFGKDDEKLEYKLAQCCNPIPGDKVFGFVTVSDGIKVHKQNCPNAISMQSQFAYRVISAKWIDSSQQEHKVLLKLTGIDHMGLVNEVTHIISSNMNVNIYNINISGGQSVFTGQITVGIKNNDQLKKLMQKLKKIDGIDKISRLNS